MLHIHFGAGRLGLGLVAPFFRKPGSELYLLNRAVSGNNATGAHGPEPGPAQRAAPGPPRAPLLHPGAVRPRTPSARRSRYDGFFAFEPGRRRGDHPLDRPATPPAKRAGVVVTASILDARELRPRGRGPQRPEPDEGGGGRFDRRDLPRRLREHPERPRGLRGRTALRADRPRGPRARHAGPRAGGPAVRRPGGGPFHAAPHRPGLRRGLRVAEAGADPPRPSRWSSSAGGAGSSSAGTSRSRSRSRAGCSTGPTGSSPLSAFQAGAAAVGAEAQRVHQCLGEEPEVRRRPRWRR